MHCLSCDDMRKKVGVLFGFRSNTSWKKVLSVLYLMFCGFMFIVIFSEGRKGRVTVYDFVINKFAYAFIAVSFLSPYLFLSNTRLRDLLPLFKKRNAIASTIGMVCVVSVLGLSSGAVSSLHSEEYKEDMKNHAYVELSSDGVSCTTGGVISLKCDYCGKIEEEKVSASGHNYEEQSRIEPDCVTSGCITFKCSKCDELSVEVLPLLGHTPAIVSKIDATCSTTGRVFYKCTVCKENVEEVVEKLEHDLVELSRKDATDYLDGEVVSMCKSCGEEITEVIPCLIPKGTINNPHIINAQQVFDCSADGTSQAMYLNQWVNITGTVLSISDHSNLKGYYLVGGPGKGVVCWVDSMVKEANYGQVINVIGKVSVADTKHIEINNCQIKSASWPDNKTQSPVSLCNWRYSIDYIGGVEWTFSLINNTDKVVKYVHMEWCCYNGVGDIICDDFTGKPNFTIKYTGPLESGQSSGALRNATKFYNHNYKSAKLTSFCVEFMDGTVVYISIQAYSDVIIE